MSNIDDARDKMAKSLIELCNFKVTLPLSDKTKNIHTNSFIYFELPPFITDSMDTLYTNMGKTKSTRWCFYRKNYWYVKNVKINYSDSNQSIDLELSPFPLVFDAQSMEGKTATATTGKTTGNDTSKVTTPSWLSKSDKKWAEKTVKKAVGSEKDKLKKAKKIYSYFKNHYKYEKYRNLRHTTPKGNREKAFKRGKGNCADGANILLVLMRTGGINARIKHAPNHYIVKLRINNKTYWVDNHGTKSWNKVWRNKTSESESNISKGEYING